MIFRESVSLNLHLNIIASYKALVNLSGTKYSFNLPGVEPKGYVLNFNSDSSDMLIKNNQNNIKSRHYLLISVRGAVYASIETRLDNKPLKNPYSPENVP